MNVFYQVPTELSEERLNNIVKSLKTIDKVTVEVQESPFLGRTLYIHSNNMDIDSNDILLLGIHIGKLHYNS